MPIFEGPNSSWDGYQGNVITKKRVEGTWAPWAQIQPSIMAQAGLVSFLIHLAYGYLLFYKMTRPWRLFELP